MKRAVAGPLQGKQLKRMVAINDRFKESCPALLKLFDLV